MRRDSFASGRQDGKVTKGGRAVQCLFHDGIAEFEPSLHGMNV